MSLRVNKDFLTHRDINSIKDDCFVEGRENNYGPPNTLRAYGETSSSLYIPFAYAKQRFQQLPNRDTAFPSTDYSFYDKEYPFRTDGGRDQEQVYEEATSLIREHRSVLLSLFCGFGKSFLSIKLAHNSGLKTAVLAHRDILFGQWEESIRQFTGAKVQRVGTSGVLDPDADFYIFNTAYVHKKWDKSTKSWGKKKLGLYKNIGMLIVDEAHTACAQDMSQALLYFNPRIVVALTATPIRKDGMDKMLELYFGEYETTRTIRTAQNPFTVYRLPTGIKPEFTKTKLGKKDWNSVIKYLVESDERNKIIIKLVKQFSKYTILILTKRKAHCRMLSEKLDKLRITNTIMVGTQKKYDKTARVLLSTYSKLGVGFDDTRLNMLIVACSVTEVEQFSGRLRHKEGQQRLIIDLVDDDWNCKNHWQQRRKWYLSRNGEIKNYYDVYPEKVQTPKNKSPEEPNEVPTEKPKRLARRIK